MVLVMVASETPLSKTEGLFNRYADDLRRFLRRYLKNTADIEDCAQEAFLNVWQRSLTGGLRDDARAYLFTTALNVVRDQRRREIVRQQDSHVSLSESTEPARITDEEAVHCWKEGLRLIENELQNLSPSTRKVFLMHHVEHLTLAQIAVRLGVSSRTVEREMARAVDHFTRVLGNFF